MTVLAFPAGLEPSEIRWGLVANTQSGGRSPLDGTEQTLVMPGARWAAEIAWRGLPEAEWRALAAFLAALGGRAGRFAFGPVHAARRATGGGTPVVNGAGQSGATLSTRAWSANAQAFLAGDFLGFVGPTGRAQLHQVTAAVTASAGGIAAVPIAPPLRRPPADGATITLASPTAVFRLSADDDLVALRGASLIGEASIRIEEAIFG